MSRLKLNVIFDDTLPGKHLVDVSSIRVTTTDDLKFALDLRRWDADATTVDKEAATMGLIGPLTTLSAHLGQLSRTLPPNVLGRLYRSIVAHIINHIMQRAVYAGWSKFTEYGGQELVAETAAWFEASAQGLQTSQSLPAVKRPALPWRPFMETARLLALPTESQDPDTTPVTFSQAVAMAFDSQFGRLSDLLDIRELDQAQTQVILRRRLDCWR